MRRASLPLVCLILVGTLGCSSASEGSQEGPELVVFAAASLTEAFGEIANSFEDGNPGTSVTLSFGPSDGLATQINSEGGVDVFASASGRWMDAVQDEGPGVQNRTDFVRNRPILIVPKDNPAGISSIDHLARPGVKLVLAAESVPIGGYARDVLANAGIAAAAEANVVSNEEDVKGVVQKVLLGEADAGIVYVTDLTPEVRRRVEPIEIPDGVNIVATYPIAVVACTEEPGLARRFLDHVTGPAGQAALESFGFTSLT
jgi:molybdate transport system substrate-binding protein